MTTSPPRRIGRNLRRDLVESTSELLQTSGIRPAVSLRAVARACHVSPGAVYRYFDSWTGLVDAALEEHFSHARTEIENAMADVTDARDRLEVFSLAYVSWAVAHQGPYQLLFESVDSARTTDAVRPWLRSRIAAMAQDLLETAAIDDLQRAVARAEHLWTALHGIISATRCHDSPQASHRNLEDEVIAMVDIFASATPPSPSAS